MLRDRRVMVTGGAGFIGSCLTAELLTRNCRVTVVDDFSAGTRGNLRRLGRNSALKVVEMDLKRPRGLAELVREQDLIFHLAANPEVRVGETEPKVHFEENVVVTFNLLEAVRQSGGGKTMVFTSTSTVYGEASQIPTREDYGPLIPISTYGASKLACEALISSYVNTFNNRALILRLANVVGLRSRHGVIFDFVKKIVASPEELEILGDGTQEKSYMYISDLIGAMMHLTGLFQESSEKTAVYNVGSKDKIMVKEIAGIVAREMAHPKICLRFTGGVDGGRGWRGDVKNMQLSIEKLLRTGWEPRYLSRQAVKLAAHELLHEICRH